jgi:hypothetical protein
MKKLLLKYLFVKYLIEINKHLIPIYIYHLDEEVHNLIFCTSYTIKHVSISTLQKR